MLRATRPTHPRALAPWILAATVAASGAGCAALAPTSDPAPIVRGPVAVGTVGPVAATLMQFPPRRAAVLDAGALRLDASLSYSSMFENGRDSVSRVVFDGEIARATVGARYGMGRRTDVEVQVPIVFASAGFLDSFIETWHDVLGFPNGGRERRPENDYAMRIDQGTRRAYELENDALLLADVPVFVTHRIVSEEEAVVGLALRAGVELPTGSESKGAGNGGFDWGGGVVLERSLGRFTFTGGAYHVRVATPDSFRAAGLELDDQSALHGAVEVRWNDDLSLLLGLRWNTAVTRDVFIEEVDGDVLELDAGFSFGGFESGRVVLGLTEDLIAESGPDWTAFVGWSSGI